MVCQWDFLFEEENFLMELSGYDEKPCRLVLGMTGEF